MSQFHRLAPSIAALTVAFAAVALIAQEPPADLIFSNGKIITVDERFSIAQAVAIRGERIVAVGSNADLAKLAGANTRRIDLKGKAVIPGLIDNHMHLFRAAATWPLETRFDRVTSRTQAIAMLRQRAATAGPGTWIFNLGGWTHHQFADDPRAFTLAELDAIAPANPVALQESYYQFTLNSRALEAMGIAAGKPDPADFVPGTIQRDAGGKPTGVIQGDIPATRPVQARLPKIAPQQLEASTLSLIGDMNKAGLTSVGVVGCLDDVLAILKRQKEAGKLDLRSFCLDGNAAATPEQADQSIEQIKAMKLFQGDHAIDSIYFGESVYSPLHDPMFATQSHPPADQLTQWRRMITAIAQAGLPLHVHAELAPTIDAFLDEIAAVNKQYPIKNLRWTFAHVNQINARQLDRMKELGMYAAVHPWAVINGGIMHEDFGDTASDMPPLATIQNSGILWGFGSDGTAANQIQPFTILNFAVTGKMVGGKKVIRQTISREDALIAYTRKNAFLVFQENNLGSLAPGKLADLLVLDRDYLTVPAEQIKDIQPVMTVLGGRIVYEAGK